MCLRLTPPDPQRGLVRQTAPAPSTVEFCFRPRAAFVLHDYVLLFVIRFRNTYTKHRSLRGANVRCSDSIPCGLTTGSWNWLVCQVEHYQRATALDGSRLHWLGTGPAVVVGFDASSLLPCQVVLGRVGSSPQVFGLGVIELARTMSRGPRARNGQNHVFNRCDGSVMTGAMPIFPPLRHRAL